MHFWLIDGIWKKSGRNLKIPSIKQQRKYNISESVGHSESSSKRVVYSHENLYKRNKVIQIKKT